MMWYWGGGVHWWGWLLGTIGMIAFWALIIWAVWYFVTGVSRRPSEPGHGPGDAKGILDERLARGEINAEEYRRLRDLMTSSGAPTGDGRSHMAAGDQR